MRAPTQAPSQFDIHRSRVRKAVSVVFALGTVMVAFGVSAPVFGLAPGAWGIGSVFEFLLTALGFQLVAMTLLIAAQFSRQEQPRPLRRRATLLIGVAAPLLATGLLGIVGLQPRVRTGSLGVLSLAWLGLAILSLQLAVGASELNRRPRRLLLATSVSGTAFVAAVLGLVRETVATPSLDTYLRAIGPAIGLFVAFGGLGYLLGYLLVRRPRYHHIP